MTNSILILILILMSGCVGPSTQHVSSASQDWYTLPELKAMFRSGNMSEGEVRVRAVFLQNDNGRSFLTPVAGSFGETLFLEGDHIVHAHLHGQGVEAVVKREQTEKRSITHLVRIRKLSDNEPIDRPVSVGDRY